MFETNSTSTSIYLGHRTIYFNPISVHSDICSNDRILLQDTSNGDLGAGMSSSQRNPPPLSAFLPPLFDSDDPEAPLHDSDGKREVLECLLPNQLPDVRGMTDNVFFFTHNNNYTEESAAAFRLESAMAVKLHQYLRHQGYHSSDLLTITTSQCQARRLTELGNCSSSVPTVRLFASTEIDYNAKKCKIVILTTLVTQPLEESIQHTEAALRTASMIATHGLFLFGNIDELCELSSLWQSVAASLEITDSLGDHLILQCEKHPQQNNVIRCARDWEKVVLGGCSEQCAHTLPCGHRCVRACHYALVDCAPCRRQTLKTLPCGHRKLSACDRPPEPCSVTVTVTLPACGHRVVRMCSQPVTDCTATCQHELPCGHQCLRPCHVNDDPDHLKYKCKERCLRRNTGCTATGTDVSHRCPLLCHEPCPPCAVPVVKARRECTHTSRVLCSANADTVPCHRTCKRVLDCKNHFCLKRCFEECEPCIKKVTLSACGHEVSVPCASSAPWSCPAACPRVLPCGHACGGPCGARCTELCARPVLVLQPADCGHQVQLPCHVYNNPSFNVSMLSQYCTTRCDVDLACGHQCSGTCAECHQGRVHSACAERCGRTNVCGHVCSWPCGASCPPCDAPCTVRCEHAACTLPCGAPCRIDCQPSTRACPHVASTWPCGVTCGAACTRRLPCGHVCRGLCGARCPDVCKLCSPETFPKDAIMMDEYDDDVRFVVLEDCGHIESVDNMDRLVDVAANEAVVRVPSCHVCRTPILNTPRYRNVLSRVWPAVLAVKERIYGTQQQINQRREQLAQTQLRVSTLYQQGSAITENNNWTTTLHLVKTEMQQKHISLPQLEMLIQSYTIVLTIAEHYADFNKSRSIQSKMALKDEVTELIMMLCRVLKRNVKRLNEQIQMDIGNELKRMNEMVQLGKILNHSAYEAMKGNSQVVAATLEARQAVLTRGRYDATKGQTALQQLQRLVQITVTKEERDLIVRAIGAKKGSWYRCPNGHVYSVGGTCMIPLQVSRCPDCGAIVGGQNYVLQPGNRRDQNFN